MKYGNSVLILDDPTTPTAIEGAYKKICDAYYYGRRLTIILKSNELNASVTATSISPSGTRGLVSVISPDSYILVTPDDVVSLNATE